MNKNSEMKKIIALSCSPSKGRNSDTMLDRFIEGVNKTGIYVEKIYLQDIQIDNYCYENGKLALPHEDEFKELTEKLEIYDGLVIATPTYNFSVPAHLKNFIDRIRFIALDLEKKNRIGQPVGQLGHLNCYFLVSGGVPNFAQKILFFTFPPFWLRGVFLYYGAKVQGAFYSGDVKTFCNKKILKKCERKGKFYAKRVIKDKGNRILEKIFWRPPEKD
jgi:putative NADPH-quinone reductase